MKTTKLLLFPLLMAAMAAMPKSAVSQVTIGADLPPQDFSVLELISNNKGLRLPQLTTAQRDALALTGNSYANGLTIFNLTTRCLEYWAVDTWKQQCGPGGPAIPAVSPSPPASCGITPTANGSATVFTAKADENAESYEFFVGGVSQGEQSSYTLTLASAPANGTVIAVKYYYPPAFLKPTMLPVPGGSSWKYGTVHTSTDIAISSFSMSETPVTQAQFEFVMDINPAYFQCGGTAAISVTTRATSAFPVEWVSWYDAITYCNKLSLLEGRTPCYTVSGIIDWAALAYGSIPTSTGGVWDQATCDFSANGYRLPTESEWEYAARGGTPSQSSYFSGTTATDAATLQTFAWYSVNNGTSGSTGPLYYGTKSVKTKLPNELGLFDMSGNVWEWCWNWYTAFTPAVTPVGVDAPTSGSTRMLRGGHWSNTATYCRLSNRAYNTPYDRNSYYGFRLASSSVE